MPISNTDKLIVYNGALRRLGSRKLSSLTENREPRRVLDDIWNNGGVVNYALERGEWNFALRSVQGAYNPDVEPEFGFTRAFDKPTDFCRLASLAADEYFRTPLTADYYSDEGGYWLCSSDTLYIKYVSSDGSYGQDSSRWTESFRYYLECVMAYDACERLTNSGQKLETIERQMRKYLSEAKSTDAMEEGVKFRPPGAWVSSRRGAMIDRRSRSQ